MTQSPGRSELAPQPPEQPGPSSFTRLAAVLIALAALGWAGFLWNELLDVRAGGEAFCALGGDGCEQLWESGFAKSIERGSGLPIAAWGVVWGVVALGLALAALLASGRLAAAAWSGVVLTAIGGIVGVLGLLAASLGLGEFCSNCALTYLLTGAFAFVVLRDPGDAFGDLARGALVSSAAVVLVAVGFLLPGWLTPSPAVQAAAAIEALELPPDASTVERSMIELYRGLTPAGLQALANALERYRNSPERPLRPARDLDGPSGARLRMTEFVDVKCSHCAALHETVRELRRKLPADAFAVERRHFPLDASCNPNVQVRGDGFRCLAARTLICVEGETWADEFADAVFANQVTLNEAMLFEIAARFTDAAELRRCAESEATAAKLRSDIAWAMAHDIPGTPLVLLDGRRADVFPVFLYAILLTGGDTGHDVFRHLPPPS